MQIVLTGADDGLEITLEASTVLSTRHDPETKVTTHVITGIQDNRGQLRAFAVRESCVEVARRVNAALRAQLSNFTQVVSAEELGFKDN